MTVRVSGHWSSPKDVRCAVRGVPPRKHKIRARNCCILPARCQGCGACLAVCPAKAVSRAGDGRRIATNRSLCRGCGACVAACPNQAREIAGRYYTVGELFLEIEKDAIFYRRSEGGVTVGGGEATMQGDFVGALLALCRDRQIHTAMETSALVPWAQLAPLIKNLDLLYIDIKHMGEKRHRELTGASNRLILENIRRAAEEIPVILRLPVVPGLNDDKENIRRTAIFAKTLGNRFLRLELLPYHRYGRHGYDELERAYAMDAVEPPARAVMESLRETAQRSGIAVEIGGS